MGLANVRRRLDTTYRHEASLTVRSEPDSTKFEAEIILPFWVTPLRSDREVPSQIEDSLLDVRH
jgi:hypothetical protein